MIAGRSSYTPRLQIFQKGSWSIYNACMHGVRIYTFVPIKIYPLHHGFSLGMGKTGRGGGVGSGDLWVKLGDHLMHTRITTPFTRVDTDLNLH